MPSPLPARSPQSTWKAYGEPLLAITVIIIATATVAIVVGRIAAGGVSDLSVMLDSARWLRQGADLYQRPRVSGPGWNLNLPATTLLFLPFSFLSDTAAFEIWTALSVGAFLLSARWIAREAGVGRVTPLAAALFISQPVAATLLLGQTTALLMLVLTAAWIADRHDRRWSAGLLLGIAVAAKPFLGVFAVYAVWRRSGSLAAGMAVGGGSSALLGLLVGGVAGYRSWLAALGQITWTAHRLNGSLLGLFTRLLSTTPAVMHQTPLVVAPQFVQPAWWAAIAVVSGIGIRALLTTRDRDRAWGVTLTASLLLSPLGWMYYAPMLAGPLLVVARKADHWTQVLLAAGYAGLLIPPMTLRGGAGATGVLLGSLSSLSLLILFAGAVRGATSPLQPQRLD